MSNRKYKEHISGMDLLQVPKSILQFYCRYEYKFVRIDESNRVPIPMMALLSLKHSNLGVNDIPLHKYFEGFCHGYNKDIFELSVGADNRIKAVLWEVFGEGGRGITVSFKGDTCKITDNDAYEYGLFEGARYKGWEYVFKSPMMFISYFTETEPTPLKLYLKDFFKTISSYQDVVSLLACHGYCDPNTNTWLDDKSGSKSVLICLIKLLYQKGYLKIKPTHDQIVLIVKDTFGVSVSKSAVDKTNTESFQNDFAFIEYFND